MAVLSLRTTISVLVVCCIAAVAAITLSLTLTSSLAALRSIGRSHAAALLDGATVKTVNLFDEYITTTEVIQNFSSKYAWAWPSDDPAVYAAFRQMHETSFFFSKLESAAILTYTADNVRWFYGPFIPEPSIYVAQHHTATSISAANWNFTAQTVANEVHFWWMANNSVVPATHWAWTVPLALSKVRESGFWDYLLMPATGGGLMSVIGPVTVVNFANVTNLYVPIIAPLRRLGSSGIFGFTVSGMYISGISQFLADIRGTLGTAAFAVDNLGFLIASSLRKSLPYETETVVAATDPLPHNGCTRTSETGGISTNNDVLQVCRSPAADYAYRPLQVAASLSVDGQPFLSYTGQAVKHHKVSGEYFYFATIKLPLRLPGLGVQLVLAMPEKDIIGDVVVSRNIAIGVTCAVVVVAALLMFVLVSLLLAPLHTVSERMMDAADLQDDAEPDALSSMQEVENLQAAYYAMNEELKRIRSFVPQSVRISKITADEFDEDAANVDTDTRTTMESSRSRRSNHARSHKSFISAGHLSAAARVSGSGRSSGNGGGATDTMAELKQMGVSVLVCNANRFTHTAAAAFTRGGASRAIGDTVGKVLEAVALQGGVLSYFNGDYFIATFNAARQCASHARRACTAALAIAALDTNGGFRCGVSTGRCLIGNAGSADAKSFNIVGHPVVQATVLERLAKLYGVPVLAPERTCADCATHLQFRFVDWVSLPGGRRTGTLIAAPLRVTNDDMMQAASAALIRPAGGGDGEWLYVVNDAEQADVNTLHNEAFRAAVRGDATAARMYYERSLANEEEAGGDGANAARAAVEAGPNAAPPAAAAGAPGGRRDVARQRLEDLMAAATAAAQNGNNTNNNTNHTNGATANEAPSGSIRAPPPRDLGLYFDVAFLGADPVDHTKHHADKPIITQS